MTSKLMLVSLLLAIVTIAGGVLAVERRATGGYVQNPSGTASFTHYSGCSQPGVFRLTFRDNSGFRSLNHNNLLACGVAGSGFTAALNQLTFGAAPGAGPGDACGRCFSLTANKDPFSPSFTGPFHTIVVKVTDLCPVAGNEEWCGQTTSNPLNQHSEPVQYASILDFLLVSSAECLEAH